MVKLVALVLLVIACTALGIVKAITLKDRVTFLQEWRDLNTRLATEISYFKEPLPEIFAKLCKENCCYASIDFSGHRNPCNVLSFCLERHLRKGKPLLSGWSEAIDTLYSDKTLTADDKALLKKIGDFLGQSNWERQQEHFNILNAQLDKHISDAEKIAQSKGGMYRKMGISVGVVVAVVLI